MEKNMLNIKMSLEDIVLLFGGPELRYIRQYTCDEREREIELNGCPGVLLEKHLNAHDIIRDINMYLSEPEVKEMGGCNIYLMAMYDIVGEGYYLHPNYSYYGICVAQSPEVAKHYFGLGVRVKSRHGDRDIKAVIIGEITLPELTNNSESDVI